MKKVLTSRNALLTLLVVFFLSLGSLGTVALANYTNVVVEASAVNVRMGPGLSYDIMTQVEGGTVVNVLSERNEWYKVRLDDGRIGWIASWLINNTEVSASQNLLATMVVTSVNVREENNTNAEIIGTATEGETYQLLYEENGWSQIYFDGRIAWVHSELVEITTGSISPQTITQEEFGYLEPSERYVTLVQDYINIRTAPSLDSEILFTANINEQYLYLGETGDFYQIQAGGQTAYVANWLADLEPLASETVRPKITTTLSEATIVIDPGHGGTDPGAVGNYLYEKQVTLETSKKIAERLRAEGANVILTRTDDKAVSLDNRVWMSNDHYADVFISIHYDSTPDGIYRTGTTTYYYDDSDTYLANLINKKLSKNLPLPNNGSMFGNYQVLRENTQPALLLELGYMNNESDVGTFNNSYYQSLVADSIYEALAEYFQ